MNLKTLLFSSFAAMLVLSFLPGAFASGTAETSPEAPAPVMAEVPYQPAEQNVQSVPEAPGFEDPDQGLFPADENSEDASETTPAEAVSEPAASVTPISENLSFESGLSNDSNGEEEPSAESYVSLSSSTSIPPKDGGSKMELPYTLPPEYQNKTEGVLLNLIDTVWTQVKDLEKKLEEAKADVKELESLTPEQLAGRNKDAQTIENVLAQIDNRPPKTIDLLAEARARVTERIVDLYLKRLLLNALKADLEKRFPAAKPSSPEVWI